MESQSWRKEPRKNYSNDFKLRMVELASRPRVCVAQIARENGINDNAIIKWLRLWQDEGPPRFRPEGGSFYVLSYSFPFLLYCTQKHHSKYHQAPHTPPLRYKGRCLWSRLPGNGLQFTDRVGIVVQRCG
ncbi:TPA: transposase [Serratia marcescens]|uniref:transposase n=1 Tax=Serratia bockelmannii TaxID=2703793 RepID=UPI00235EC22B|nr:transposase [Serratia bockelmannii]